MSLRYKGAILSSNVATTSNTTARGIWTLQQQYQARGQGNWPLQPPAVLVIGQSYQGGYYAGQISTSGNGIANFNLVIAPVSSGQDISEAFKTTNTGTAGTSSVIDGPTNSSNMNNASHPAAQFCEGLSIGGYSDWYMPAKNELEVCYYNLKPTTDTNNTNSGTNTNAVPSRGSNYTSGTPAQTSASDFKDTGAEDFLTQNYWSSTEVATYFAWRQNFYNGQQNYAYKTNSVAVRAVRRVAV
jgi:hypothetical protein